MSREKVRVKTVAVSLGCNCRRLFRSKPKLKSSDKKQDMEESSASSVNGGGLGRIGVAVEKESDDPYLDFRQSMLQMIVDKEIYSKDGLTELLNCFLQLNSPYYHGIIVRAFTDIWNGLYSLTSSTPTSIFATSSPSMPDLSFQRRIISN